MMKAISQKNVILSVHALRAAGGLGLVNPSSKMRKLHLKMRLPVLKLANGEKTRALPYIKG